MRGAPTGGDDVQGDGGIIPADAGSTSRRPSARRLGWDHPRGCGEHQGADNQQREADGSSPRMRGAPMMVRQVSFRMRIIPADAGSTVVYAVQAFDDRDHPRGCGEHWTCTATWPHAARDHPRGCGEHDSWMLDECRRDGSSPRMRGAPGMRAALIRLVRIIPADAGSTASAGRTTRATQDHPRGCGEHTVISGCSLSSGGSSPRMRGARLGLSRNIS